MTTNIGTWIGAICTLAMFSFLVKENKVFRSFQHLYVGVAAGYGIVFQFNSIKNVAWDPLTKKGDMLWIVPIILGLLLFSRFIRGYQWISRWPLAFLMGLGAGLSMKAIESDFVRQVQASLITLTKLDNIIIVVGTVTALAYFYFTVKPSKALSGASMIGRYVLMMTFGAAFGNAVMGRISLLIGQMQFLFGDWILLIKR
ncbi:MAG: hypothetical protein Q8P50_07745 [Bacillota bacterium]|nr:hypothetical protein [Bacillota bacterium]